MYIYMSHTITNTHTHNHNRQILPVFDKQLQEAGLATLQDAGIEVLLNRVRARVRALLVFVFGEYIFIFIIFRGGGAVRVRFHAARVGGGDNRGGKLVGVSVGGCWDCASARFV
jgi:hypothetical protein